MSMKSQLLKGILEGCMLAIISKQSVYGYELSMKLLDEGLDVSEGSIYPILLRLQKEGLIEGKLKKSSEGPNRKYYFLTEKGEASLVAFKINWDNLKTPVDHILKEDIQDGYKKTNSGKQSKT